MCRGGKIIILGATAFVLSGVFPPWVYTFSPPGARPTENPAGYHLIFDPPPPTRKSKITGVQIDYVRLLIQWAVIGVAVAGATALRPKELLLRRKE